MHASSQHICDDRDIDLSYVQQLEFEGGHGKMAVSEKRVCAYDAMVGHLLSLRTSALWPSLDWR